MNLNFKGISDIQREFMIFKTMILGYMITSFYFGTLVKAMNKDSQISDVNVK